MLRTNVPDKGAVSSAPASRWEEAFLTGNGRMGAMLFGDPQNEILVANHCRLFLPLGSREIVSDLVDQMPEAREIIRNDGFRAALDFLETKAREQGFPGIIRTDPLHPGFFVHIKQGLAGEAQDYVRTEDFRSGEVAVRWRDDRAAFNRRLFVSRPDNVIVFVMETDGKSLIDCELAFPLPQPVDKKEEEKGWRADLDASLIISDRLVSSELVTFHNVYARGKGGYDAGVRISLEGGQAEVVEDCVQIRGADRVVMLMRIVPWKTPMPLEESEAWAYSKDNPDFTERVGQYEPVPKMSDSSVVPYLKREDAGELMPKVVAALNELESDYDKLFDVHRVTHAELFDRVSLNLDGGELREKTSEELLALARDEGHFSNALMEKIYDGSRYLYICCAGELPPNLQGIWTGSWSPAWSGDFTLDTNLQLAIQHAFSAGLGELMDGYFNMVEGFYPEWEINAKRTYGCRGYMTNARASNTALLLHWGKWPGIFWTGGCSWLTHFFYDHWQFTGDETFLQDRTIPLLKEVVTFYEDFVQVDPDTGRYVFIPSFSPETGGGITSTMDIMVCKDALRSLIQACRVLDIEQESIPGWEAMLAKLPDYKINEDGALAEWPFEDGRERYEHRHLSHLHSCYEALEDPELQNSPELWAAAQEALRRRIHSGGEVSSHGRMHMGLAAAYLRMADEAYGRLEVMATGESMYASMMCSHEPDARIFNFDANGTMPEILHRMLVQSHPGSLDLLPALPEAWSKGEICGIKVRQQITIDRLAWDQKVRHLELQLTSEKDQHIVLHVSGSGQREVALEKGETVTLDIDY